VNFDKFEEKVRVMFGIDKDDDFSLKYYDADEEYCTIGCNESFEEAISSSPKDKIIRIFLVFNDEDEEDDSNIKPNFLDYMYAKLARKVYLISVYIQTMLAFLCQIPNWVLAAFDDLFQEFSATNFSEIFLIIAGTVFFFVYLILLSRLYDIISLDIPQIYLLSIFYSILSFVFSFSALLDS